MSHTPGIWKVDCTHIFYAINADTRHIAVVSSYAQSQDDIEENEANANLVAAAPELLAACEAEEDADTWDKALEADTIRETKLMRIPIHERWYESVCQEFDCLHFNDSNQLRQLAKRLRRRAIAKARGEK
jgi:hypothetical protein